MGASLGSATFEQALSYGSDGADIVNLPSLQRLVRLTRLQSSAAMWIRFGSRRRSSTPSEMIPSRRSRPKPIAIRYSDSCRRTLDSGTKARSDDALRTLRLLLLLRGPLFFQGLALLLVLTGRRCLICHDLTIRRCDAFGGGTYDGRQEVPTATTSGE